MKNYIKEDYIAKLEQTRRLQIKFNDKNKIVITETFDGWRTKEVKISIEDFLIITDNLTSSENLQNGKGIIISFFEGNEATVLRKTLEGHLIIYNVKNELIQEIEIKKYNIDNVLQQFIAMKENILTFYEQII